MSPVPATEHARPGAWAFTVGAGVWAGLAAILLVSTLGWAAGTSIPRAALLLGLLSSAAVALGLGKESGLRGRGLWLAALTPGLLTGIAALAAGVVYDVSYDGQFYHQVGVIQLAGGWNPLRDAPLQLGDAGFWVNHYAKGAWTAQAAVYALTGRIEQAKGLNLAVLVASGLLVFGALRAYGLRGRASLALASLLALNPVALCQLASFYVDGQLAGALLSVAALGASLRLRPSRWSAAVLACATLYAVNLKFTAVVYLGVAGAALLVLAVRRAALRPMVVALAVGGVVGVVGVGWSPYVTNTLRAGHPFFPLMGEKKVDIITSQVARSFFQHSRPSQFVRGILSATSNSIDHEPHWKVPFRVSLGELGMYVQPDVRFGGFGPWFGGAVLLALVLSGLLVLRREPPWMRWVAALGLVALTVALNPAPWWARYVPQLWWIPVGVAAWATASHARGLRLAGRTLALILGVNLLLTGGAYSAQQALRTVELGRELRALAAQAEGQEVVTGPLAFPAQGVRLREAGIRLREGQADCQKPFVFSRWPQLAVCVPPRAP